MASGGTQQAMDSSDSPITPSSPSSSPSLPVAVRLGTLPAPSMPPPPRSQRPTGETPIRDRDSPVPLIPPGPTPPPPSARDREGLAALVPPLNPPPPIRDRDVPTGPLPAPTPPPPPIRDRDSPIALIPPTPAPESVAASRAIADQLAGLERWASANRRHATRTAVRFWLLKAVAGGGAIAASVAASFGWMPWVAALTALVVLAVAIDSASSAPPNFAHEMAFADIRHLQNSVKLSWDKVCVSRPDPQDPARQLAAIAILDEIQAKREQIRRYMASPEAALGPGQAA
jgi:hypothetical protein